MSATAICYLEQGIRRPSVVMAEILIDGYQLPSGVAGRLLAVAAPFGGRSSPFRTGVAPAQDESMRNEDW